jgi:hypothetical protein
MNAMLRSIVYTVATALLMILLSCGSMIPEKEAWEGFRNTSLRVCVQQEYTDDFDGRINAGTKELLLKSGGARAEVVLMSYIRRHVTAFDKVNACQQMIPGISASGTIRYIDCGIDYCRAYIDYPVANFLKAAGSYILR